MGEMIKKEEKVIAKRTKPMGAGAASLGFADASMALSMYMSNRPAPEAISPEYVSVGYISA